MSDIADTKSILTAAKSVAVVGLSPKPDRDSNAIARYLREAGYRIVPVNPGFEDILGERCYPSLKALPAPVDIVDVFRNSEAALEIVREAVAMPRKPLAIWLQFGVVNEEAKALAESHGIAVFMDHCIKVDHATLAGA